MTTTHIRSAGRPGSTARHGADRGRPGSSPGNGGAAPQRGSAPLPASALELLARSDAELVAAQLASEPHERFLHAHLAALRAGAALLQVTGRPARRRAPQTVWDMVAVVAPELSPWTAFFADGAAARAALEAGRDAVVDDHRADLTVRSCEDFQDAVRSRLGTCTAPGPRPLALRAS